MKKLQKATILWIAISVLSVGLAASFVTWAWVTMRTDASSGDVEMTIEVSSNLVISDRLETLRNYTISDWDRTYVTKNWTEEARELIPADHFDPSAYPQAEGTNTYNLVYNTNPENVSRKTGKRDAGADELTFAHVPSDGEGEYFIDRVVYIASLDKAMNRGTDFERLSFSMTEVGTGTATNPAYRSASVDVYINGVFRNTLNLDTSTSFSVADVARIPLNTDTGIEITFRCYFDGALVSADNGEMNYVNSISLAGATVDIAFNVTIEALEN